MKIGQPSHGAVNAATPSGAGAAKPAAPTAADPKGPGVAVSLSAQTREMSAAHRGDADVDMDKVNAMTQAIQNGTFKVNPEAIADKLLANAQEMLQGRMH